MRLDRAIRLRGRARRLALGRLGLLRRVAMHLLLCLELLLKCVHPLHKHVLVLLQLLKLMLKRCEALIGLSKLVPDLIELHAEIPFNTDGTPDPMLFFYRPVPGKEQAQAWFLSLSDHHLIVRERLILRIDNNSFKAKGKSQKATP